MTKHKDDDKIYWALLACAEAGIGAGTLRQLAAWLDNNGIEIAEFWEQTSKYAPALGWNQKRLEAMGQLHSRWPVAKFADYLEKRQIRLVMVGDVQYPKLLRFIPDYAPVLFYRGQIEVLSRPSLAVVGSRQVSDYGRRVVRELVGGLGARLTIVSGMMVGVDALSHQAAMHSGAATAAFLGYGLEQVWPAQLSRLKEEIVSSGGVIISEFAPWLGALPRRFPMRNRLVAGSSVATLVVEAAEKSGSLITANLAADYGREVMSVPGSIFSPTSMGTLELIRRGAWPVTSSGQIIETLLTNPLTLVGEDYYQGMNVPVAQEVGMAPAREFTDPWQARVYELISKGRYDSDGLLAACGGDTQSLTALGLLELLDAVEQGSDGCWQVKN